MSEQSDYQPKGGPLTGRKVLMILVGFLRRDAQPSTSTWRTWR